MNTKKIVYFWRLIKNICSQLAKLYTKKEKLIISFLVLVLIITGGVMIYQGWINNTIEVADFGGTYREGIVSQTSEDIASTVNKLTKIGLTRFDDDGNIVPEVAESWEISNEVKTYTFTIKSQFSRDDVLKELQKQIDLWQDIQIEAFEDNKIRFNLPDSYSPFLASTTSAVLPFGPYTLQDKESTQLTFIRNENYYLDKAYLEKIIIKIYPDEENLLEAYGDGKIDGVYSVDPNNGLKSANTYSMDLPRYNMLFLNLDREVVKDKSVRQKIKNYEKLDSEISLMLVVLDTEENREVTEELVQRWQELNIKTDVYYKTSYEILEQIIPSRDYDVLIYGLNYGYDPDPYPFWHSTQSGENGFNLSNFSDIDADIALEESRQTDNDQTRKEKYDKFWSIFDEEVPAIILSQGKWYFAVSDKYKNIITGYSVGPEDRFLEVGKWYLKTKRVSKEK